MYPSRLAEGTVSAAERLLYRELQRQLPDDYIVMHGVTWLTRRRRFDESGEADFLIVHPRRGILVLEVKGGQIRGEWAEDDWTSTSRNGETHRIKNPVKQADRAYWMLRDKLGESPSTAACAWPMFRGVAFPDTLLGNAAVGIDWDRDLVLDSSGMNDLTRAVERMYSKDAAKDPLPKAAVDALVTLLQPTVALTRMGLATEMRDGETRILELSEEQSRLLRALRCQRRVVIDGCAGSGKTLLAAEKAMQLADEGFSVLLTCFNKNLAAWLRQVVNARAGEAGQRIRVGHYHDLAVKLCEEAGRPSTVRPSDQSYWDDDLPDDLLAALPSLETRFDAIVVDEGQDFRDNWWVTIEALLADPKDGVFYIFQDPRQAIYERTSDLPIPGPPLVLENNYRSTTAIHSRVVDYYDGEPKPGSIGPKGRPIEVISPTGAGVRDDLRRVLARLLGEEGLLPSQIVVLTPSSQARSALRDGQKQAGVALAWSATPGAREVRVSTIHGFKGLESDVVVLAEVEGFRHGPGEARLWYVALSRAKHHLVVIGDLPDVAQVAERAAPGAMV